VAEVSEACQLELSRQRTRREELKLQRMKLWQSRNAMLIGIWVLLALVSIVVVICCNDDTIRWALGYGAVFGFIMSLVVFNRVA
jgi:hypothetical protein